MLTRIRSEERGMALIIALLITFVITLLAITVVELSVHNVQQSGYDRKRVQSVNAGEAGVDYVWNTIEQAQPQNLQSSYSGSLGTGPGTASFNASVTYYDSSQTALASAPSQSNVPAYALITSTGTTNGTVTRKVQSYVKLTPIRQGIQSAVLINSGASFANNFTLNGDTGNDADVHIESGDLSISNQPNIFGSVYVSNGTFTLRNNNTVHGNAWAWGAVDVQAPAAVLGYVRSSSSSVGSSGTVGGDVTAGTTIAAGLSVSGSKYANSPTTTHPPAANFPIICWVTTGSCTGVGTSFTTQDYMNNTTRVGSATNPNPDGVADWTVVTKTDCTSARNFLLNGGTIAVDTVLRVTGCSNLQINNNESITFSGNLAIFTDGSITMNNQNNWNGQSNNSLLFIVNYQGVLGSCSNNITTSNNSNFNNVYVSFYSPCTVTIANQNAFSGQILGQAVNLTNNFTLNYKPVLIPGVGKVIGFQQDVVYEREIA